MADQMLVVPWTRTGWRDDVDAWIHAELAARGIELQGAIEAVRESPWSTVLRVATSAGALFFKAVSPVDPHETVVLQALAQWRPDDVPALLALNEERGWMIMRGGGDSLRGAIRPTRDMRPWFPVLPRYAALQIAMAEHVSDLLAGGVPDRRLATLADLYEPLLADRDTLRIDRPNGLSDDQHRRLVALTPRVRELCEQLAAFGIPATLNHGDLNDGNVLIGEGWPVFIDWGDSCVSHPFFSLRTVLVSAEISLDLEENAPELQLLRDAYLAAWTRWGSPDELAAALAISARLAAINGALTWHRIVSQLEGPAGEEHAVPVPALLQEFLDLEMASAG